MNPVRVGILGTGTIVRGYHLPALAANPRARVVAIGNARRASLDAVAREFSVPRTYTDFDEMARDAQIDAVVNALPNYLHAPVTTAMLQSGKHVLCEKPTALNAEEARQMVEAAEAAGRKLMIAHVWRASPEVQWVRDVIRSGALGTVRLVKAHAVVAGRGPRLDSWFVRPELAGGGALADVGIHSIDTISFLFDDKPQPTRVWCRIENNYQPVAVEDTASLRIEYDNGMAAEIEAGWFHPPVADPHGAVEVFGTDGYIRTLPTRLKLRVAGVAGESTPSFPSRHPDDNLPIYAAQVDQFLDCILENRPAPCDGQQGLRNMRLLDAAYQSARCGASVVMARE